MFHPRETNPHFQPRTQRYAQLHDPDGSDSHAPQLPQRFGPSPPSPSLPPKVPILPSSQRVSQPSQPSPATHGHQGIGISRYPSPPLRVPPTRKANPLTWLIAICCVLFWIIIILGGLILLIVYLAYRPRYPKFDIASASLNAVYLDLGYLLNGDLTLLANFTNPNKKVNVEFRYMVINLYFEGTLIAARYIEPLSVSRRGYELRDVHMVSSQIPFSRRHIAQLNEQMRTGRIMFEAKSFLRTTSNLGGFFRYSYWLHGHCKFVVSGPPSGILVAKSCVTKR